MCQGLLGPRLGTTRREIEVDVKSSEGRKRVLLKVAGGELVML